MDDLISRKVAIDALAKFVPYAICDESTESYTNGLTDAYNLICQLPSAEPVRHGKWIWKGEDGDSRWMCSECKCKEYVPTCNGVPNIWNYCPNCGARMDEE